MTIDLNSDLGESFGAWTLGDDEAMLDIVTSANVACGFHAGDASVARRVCRAAAARGVAVGAHVGYRDLAGFGRRFIDVAPGELADQIVYQIGALQAIARAEGTHVSYVKPHGALYNAIVHHTAQAAAVVDGVRAVSRDLAVVGLPGSVVLGLAERAGLLPVPEAFADRAYAADGTLVPRGAPGAVVHDPTRIAERVGRLIERGEIVAQDGSIVPLEVRSICVHGDTPDAVAVARATRKAMDEAGTRVASFAGGNDPAA